MNNCPSSNKTTQPTSCSPAPDACPKDLAEACPSTGPLAWFDRMIPNCLEYARQARQQGRPIVGIMCEYTPRELIMAAGAVPVCLCGGSAEMIGPAERDLPANLCPLIKSTYGYHVEAGNPFLEMADLIVAETTCDGKKKMYELMGGRRLMYVLELPQKPDDADAFDHWKAELRKLRAELERRFGVVITDDGIREAIRTMNRERALRRELAALMKSDAPALTGRQLLQLKSSISGIAADLDKYAECLQWLAMQRPARCDGRVRVLLTGVPVVHGAERVVDIIESAGGLIVAMDNCTGLKPILEDVETGVPSVHGPDARDTESADDPVDALARKYFSLPCSVMTRNNRRLAVLEELAAEYRPDCVIDLVWQACLTYDVESWRVKDLAENRLGLPFMKIVTDYSPSDSARIAMRVEALFETARGGGPPRSTQSEPLIQDSPR